MHPFVVEREAAGDLPTDIAPQRVGGLSIREALDFLRIIEPAMGALPGDSDADGDVDLDDYSAIYGCLTGPGIAADAQCGAGETR